MNESIQNEGGIFLPPTIDLNQVRRGITSALNADNPAQLSPSDKPIYDAIYTQAQDYVGEYEQQFPGSTDHSHFASSLGVRLEGKYLICAVVSHKYAFESQQAFILAGATLGDRETTAYPASFYAGNFIRTADELWNMIINPKNKNETAVIAVYHQWLSQRIVSFQYALTALRGYRSIYKDEGKQPYVETMTQSIDLGNSLVSSLDEFRSRL